jgi:NADPH2:quinone reductase
MLALRFDRFGDPSVLSVAGIPDPVATATEAVIKVHAASVNPSDVKNVAGTMQGTVLPRVPGRDFAGVVVDGPAEWRGVPIWGTGGDVGFTRDGSHAEFMSLPVDALVRKPAPLTFEEASVVGVNFVVGWLGAVETARLDRMDTIAVFGVSGSVGGAVAQIAHLIGARVRGVDRHEPGEDAPAAASLDAFVRIGEDADVAGEVRGLTRGRGVDVVYDAVGGVTTSAALASLAYRGRLVVISAVGSRTVEIDLIDLYHNETQILGSDSRKFDAVRSARRLDRLSEYFERGLLRPTPVTASYALSDGKAAYQAVAERKAGRVVITP